MTTIKRATKKFGSVEDLKKAFKETIVSILANNNIHISDDKIDFYVENVLNITDEQRKKSKSSDMNIYINKFANILSNSEAILVNSIVKGLEYKFGKGNVVDK